jgi:hypothetical protein
VAAGTPLGLDVFVQANACSRAKTVTSLLTALVPYITFPSAGRTSSSCSTPPCKRA